MKYSSTERFRLPHLGRARLALPPRLVDTVSNNVVDGGLIVMFGWYGGDWGIGARLAMALVNKAHEVRKHGAPLQVF